MAILQAPVRPSLVRVWAHCVEMTSPAIAVIHDPFYGVRKFGRNVVRPLRSVFADEYLCSVLDLTKV